MNPSPLRLSIIIPVHDGGENLRLCLEALAASTRSPDEVIVVDDGSTDGSGGLARQYGAHVVRLDGPPHGPACARNRGAEAAHGDILVFLDADVVVHPDTLARTERHLAEHPEIAALFGSYDADPPACGLVTRYKNLMHHYVHQHGRREASTFWAGCGGIRRDVFAALGGFDEAYTHPAIEDIELGARLRDAGHRVWLCPDVQVTHLKRWTFAGMLRSDVFDRAIPWTRLILRDAHLPRDLNLDARSRLSALTMWIALVCLVLGSWSPWAWMGVLLALVALGMLNAGLYRFFARKGGLVFAAGAVGLHALYLIYSSLIFGSALGWHALQRIGEELAPKLRGLARPQSILLLLLLITLLKGWLWSVIVPMWQANDEESSFGYAQEIARQHTWWALSSQQVTEERALLWELLRPFKLSGQREPLDLSPAGLDQINSLKRQLDTPAARTTSVPAFWLPYFMRQHPPLYYSLQAAIHQLGAERNILVRMAWMRILSVIMAVGAVGCAYGAAHTIWPDQKWFPLAVATLVSFHPLFTFFTSVVNNAALEILCWAGVVWLTVIVTRRGMNWRRGLMLGGAMAAGLLTRSSFLAAVPLVAALWGWETLQTRGRCHWGGWGLTVIIPLALAGWWYADFLVSGGSAMVEVYRSSPPPPEPLPLLRYLRYYPWLTRYRPFLRQWWGMFGSRDTPYPPSIYATLEGLTLLAFFGWGWLAVQRLRKQVRGQRISRGDWLALAIGIISTVALIAFYTALDYRAACSGGGFKIQGRYFLAAVVAQVMGLAVGWKQLGHRWVLPALCAGMIGLNTYTLAGVLIPRYYGEQIAVRHEPTADTVTLAPNVAARRAFVTEGKGFSRVDVWLNQVGGEAALEATFTLYEDGRAVVQIPIESRRMTFPYPTLLRFRARPVGTHQYVVTVHGNGVEARLSEDGQLALKAYHRVPVLQIPRRTSVVQPDLYSTSFILLLSAIYLLWLGFFVWACLHSGARTGFLQGRQCDTPIPLTAPSPPTPAPRR